MRSGIILIFCLLLLSSCREPYQPPILTGQSNLLVVDGFLDGEDGSCAVVLSRSQDLSDTQPPPMEAGAIVQLEDDGGIVYSLSEQSSGNYIISNIPIDLQRKYRLHIKTQAGNSYLSDYVEIKNSPPIDSVTWDATDQGIQFYVNAHDDEKKSIYYQYRYEETWEYESAFQSFYKYENQKFVTRTDDIYHCWKTLPSSKISIASSAKLNKDIVSNFPLTLVPKYSEKYLIRYSILVEQNVLSNDAYNYWQQLQKNTEKLGTLFDPLPSQILSNIKNMDNSDERVLGYFNAGIVAKKRIFVSFNELPDGWNFRNTECRADTVLLTEDLGILTGFGMLVVSAVYGGNSTVPTGYTYSNSRCVDCREAGGANQKPDFW